MQLSGANAGDFSPSDFVLELERRQRIVDSQGGRETLDGYEAWVGRVAVPREGGAAVIAAAFVRHSPQLMLQVIGQTASQGDANESAIFASIRSFQKLTDAGRLGAQPDRVRVLESPKAGPFGDVIGTLGPQALDAEGTAILNNAQLEGALARGQLLKIVEPGKRR
jgi:predicted Zn-dependent protease